MDKEKLGLAPSGEEIYAYTLVNASGMQAKIMNYGCNLLELWVPDKEGILSDVVLGYEKLEDYFVNSPGFGCCVTPNANRIGNASFTLNGKTYEMEVEACDGSVKASAPVAAPKAAPAAPKAAAGAGSVKVEAGAAGKVFKIEASVGQAVKKGDTVVVIEAMKMEIPVVAPEDGTVASIDVAVGDAVEAGACLATLK